MLHVFKGGWNLGNHFACDVVSEISIGVLDAHLNAQVDIVVRIVNFNM